MKNSALRDLLYGVKHIPISMIYVGFKVPVNLSESREVIRPINYYLTRREGQTIEVKVYPAMSSVLPEHRWEDIPDGLTSHGDKTFKKSYERIGR